MDKKINRVITFYSYKGGVGRSMAMANIGMSMAGWGFRTLVIDWDLEAPGLENYYKAFLDVSRIEQRPGIIDLLRLKINEPSIEPGNINWDGYLNPVYTNDKDNQQTNLYLLTAGKRDEEYIEKVRQFDYTSFYSAHNGGDFLEDIREYWLSKFDLVLIDSRTGLTDSSGICSIHMPDILVLLFTPNEQSFNGVIDVAEKAREGQKGILYDRFELRTLPVPCRIENAETLLLDEWMNKIIKGSERMLTWLPRQEKSGYLVTPAELINQLKIPYKTLYAYGERLAVVERTTTDPNEIGYVYETIAAFLANDLQDAHLLIDSRDSLLKKVKGQDFKDNSELLRKFEQEVTLKNKAELLLIEQEKKKRKAVRVTAISVTLIVAVVLSIIIFFSDIYKTKAVAITNDSINQRFEYADFIATYSSYKDPNELDFNLRMLKRFYGLNPQYRDTLNFMKQQMEGVISEKSYSILKDYYLNLQNKTFDAIQFFDDTVQAFGELKSIMAQGIQDRIDSVADIREIRNFLVDSGFDLSSDADFLYARYMEGGNVLLDRLMAFKAFRSNVTVAMNYNLKIDSIHYDLEDSSSLIARNIFAGLVPRMRIELFVDSRIKKDKELADLLYEYLSKSKYVIRRRTFKNPANTSSPYYVSGNEIRYNGMQEKSIADTLQAKIGKALALQTSVKAVRTNSPNMISIFINSTK